MNYIMKRIADNVVIMETDMGNTIKLIFQEEDNPDIEDIITNNLMMSYEERIKKSIADI